jgi:hypothetical protein
MPVWSLKALEGIVDWPDPDPEPEPVVVVLDDELVEPQATAATATTVTSAIAARRVLHVAEFKVPPCTIDPLHGPPGPRGSPVEPDGHEYVTLRQKLA